MKREILKTMDGKEVVALTPETPEDMAELERLQSEGKLEIADSFAAQHELREGRRKGEDVTAAAG